MMSPAMFAMYAVVHSRWRPVEVTADDALAPAHRRRNECLPNRRHENAVLKTYETGESQRDLKGDIFDMHCSVYRCGLR